MSSFALSRRSLIGAGIGGAALAGLGDLPALAREMRLRMFWWGAKERAERTDKVNQLYLSSHPDMTIAGESLGWTDYWPRLATQTAGRNAADVLQMDYRYIFEYARRGALLPLDDYVPKALNLTDFSPAAVDSGKVDGKIYGVSLGLNSTAMVYDKALIQSLGLKEPGWNMTLERDRRSRGRDHQGRQARRLYRHGGRRWQRAGCSRSGCPARQVALHGRRQARLRRQGHRPSGSRFWVDLRKRGACAAPDTQALDRGEIDIEPVDARQGRDDIRPLQPAGRLPGHQQEQARPLDLSRWRSKARNPASI